MLLQPLDQMFSPPVVAATTNLTWTAIPAFLKAEVAAGESSSARSKARTASGSLLRARKLTPENACINLDWFDRTFPLDGWDESMPIQRETWVDNIYRVRPVIERMTGASAATKELRARDDDWAEAGAHLGGLEVFKSLRRFQAPDPVSSTLTMAARRAGLGTGKSTRTTFKLFTTRRRRTDKRSLRSDRSLSPSCNPRQQRYGRGFHTRSHRSRPPVRSTIRSLLSSPPKSSTSSSLHPGSATSGSRRSTNTCELGTRINYRTTLHATVGGLIAVGRLRQDANGFASVLEDPDALDDLVNHTLERIEAGKITARSATA